MLTNQSERLCVLTKNQSVRLCVCVCVHEEIIEAIVKKEKIK